jgi:hypothetical protein
MTPEMQGTSDEVTRLTACINELTELITLPALSSGDEPVIGLPPGQHKVSIDVAGPDHHVFTAQTVTFALPGPAK